MNIVTNTTAWPSVNSAASSGAAVTGPATDATAATSTAVAPTAATQVQGQHHHHHHEHHDDGDEHSGHHDQQAYMALQIKVEQTFSALTAPSTKPATSPATTGATAPAADGEGSGGFAAMLKAKFSLSEGGMSASLSIRMSAEGQAAGGDMAAQMQGFVQTLYAALHTLFGGSPATPNATAGTPVSTGAAAALTGPATPTAPTGTAPSTATGAATDLAATTLADGGTPAAPVDAKASAAAPASAAPASSSSLSIRVRLTYNSFGSQLGPLTQQLAQPGAASAAPGMADLLGDLSTRFGQMLSLTSGANTPSLGDFLNALAKSFAPSAGTAPNSGTGTATASNDQAPAVAPTVPAQEAANPPATTSAPAPYGQLLSFSASIRSQWLMAA